MKGPSLKRQLGADESNRDEKITNAIIDAISANDKVIEIRPANRSKGMGLRRLLLLGAASIGLAYWARNSQRPKELIESVREQTATRTHQAAETIEAGGETASKRIEEGSDRAGKAVQEAGDKVAERTEEMSDKAADRTEKTGKKAAEQTGKSGKKGTNKTDSSSRGSSGT